jgi:hypothetical protein
MTCEFQSLPFGSDNGSRLCSLGLYGGRPFVGACMRCIANGENTPEFAAKLRDRADVSHPSSANQVSGCCDSARNYLTHPSI